MDLESDTLVQRPSTHQTERSFSLTLQTLDQQFNQCAAGLGIRTFLNFSIPILTTF